MLSLSPLDGFATFTYNRMDEMTQNGQREVGGR